MLHLPAFFALGRHRFGGKPRVGLEHPLAVKSGFCLDVAHSITGKHHGHELIPSSKESELALRPKTVFCDGFEIMSRNKLQQLRKDCATKDLSVINIALP